MKGFSIPNISIPKVSVPNISFNGTDINVSSIESAIKSSIPDLESVVKDFDIEQIASQAVSDFMDGGVELPSELKAFIK